MNERIKEIAAQAREFATTKDAFGEYVIAFDNEKFEQKFAELLIRQCAQIGEDTDGNWNVKNEILKNFGLVLR